MRFDQRASRSGGTASSVAAAAALCRHLTGLGAGELQVSVNKSCGRGLDLKDIVEVLGPGPAFRAQCDLRAPMVHYSILGQFLILGQFFIVVSR